MAFRTYSARGKSLLRHSMAATSSPVPGPTESTVVVKTPETRVAEYTAEVMALSMPENTEEQQEVAAQIRACVVAANDKTEARSLVERVSDLGRHLRTLSRLHRMDGRWAESDQVNQLARRAELVMTLIS